MAVSYKYENICEGADYTEIIDKRFKTNYVYINLINRMDMNTASANSLVPMILRDSNEKYPSMTLLSRKLSSLYDASVMYDVLKFGDLQVLSLASWSIADKYTIDGENINDEVIDILLDCFTKPRLENGVFPEEDFQLKKQELIDDIEAVVNDKRRYAALKGHAAAYEGEEAGIPVSGTHETAEDLTSEEVYKRYRELLKTADIKVVFAGNEISPGNKQKIFDRIRSLERGTIVKTDISVSPIKETTKYCTDKMEVTQSKMVMALKSDIPDISRHTMTLLSAVYGGTPFSLLFDNVREKLSLCYYCSSGYVPVKNVIFINSGVEFENIEAAQKEINNQLEAIRKGEVTEKLIADTKRYLKRALKSVFDRPAALANYYFKELIYGSRLTPENEARAIDEITAGDIIAAAESLRLDTVYVLTGKEIN